MTGKGWTWIGTDGATTSTFVNSPNLQLAMQGMVGTRPKNGEGALYQKLLKTWKEKDAALYPGLIHSPRVLQVSLQYIFDVFAVLLSYSVLDYVYKEEFLSWESFLLKNVFSTAVFFWDI